MSRYNNYNRRNPPIVLNVAEKPSVARALAAVFGQMHGSTSRPMQRHAAAQIFKHENVLFPFIYEQAQSENGIHNIRNRYNRRNNNANATGHTMITTSVRGHLASQDFSTDYGWSSCAPIVLFEAPIRTFYRSDMEPLEQMLRHHSSQVDALILWLDCDREGEAIADEVREVCNRANPNLNQNTIFRATFSTVMKQEIERALFSLGRVNEYFVQAVRARSELDLRVGAAFTRFQTLRLQKKFDGFQNGGVVSYGPCQFPTLGFVVERWARIKTFVPENFWFLEMKIEINDKRANSDQENTDPNQYNSRQQQSKQIHLSWKRGRLYDRLLTLVFYESCLDANQAVVTSLTGRHKNKWRPIPLATVELQKRASKYLRIGSETLMTAAEELYQQGLISYPRTETEKFSAEFEHMSLIRSFQPVEGEIGNYATKLMTESRFQTPRAGPNDDKAHPPITPCKAIDPNQIADPTQRKIYLLIVKHYLACCSRDAVGKETNLVVTMGSEEFTARGLMIEERNWLEIYSPWERWGTGQGQLPKVQIGTRITPLSLLMKDGTTTPPLPISEVELISLMDKNGIGTDATIAQHIATIMEREYATKDAHQKFHPTKLGIALVEGYNNMGYKLNKPDIRRETEHECNLVANGQKTKEEIMEPLLRKMKDCFVKANAEAHKLDNAVSRHFQPLGSDYRSSTVLRDQFSTCGRCQNKMTLKQLSHNGRSNNRNTRRRKILYCATCTKGYTLPVNGEPKPMIEPSNNLAKVCPICQFQVLEICRGSGYEGNGYKMCPNCFSNPPVEHGGSSGGMDFRCFNCSHHSCSLAGGTTDGDIEVYSCPFCHRNGTVGKICLKRSARGFVLGCSNYNGSNGGVRCQYTVWLPRETKNVTVERSDAGDEAQMGMEDLIHNNSICINCSNRPDQTRVRKLKFEWKSGSIPPHVEKEYTGCVLCDDFLQKDMSINLPQFDRVGNRTNQWSGRGSRNSSTATRRGRPGRGRQNNNNNSSQFTCYKCGQPGHFASSCPNSNQ